MVSFIMDNAIDFKWGKRKGVGAKNKDVKFYLSFTLDGVEYALYDAVYLWDEVENDPHIGLLIKIWENPDGSRRVKILWFFRPCEISNFIGTETFAENELFLASGEGVGLTNINPLEAIAGKCNVVFISEDSGVQLSCRNEIKDTEYVVHRTFDVGQRIIIDKLDNKIAGIGVKHLLSRIGNKNSYSMVSRAESENAVVAADTNGVKPLNGTLDGSGEVKTTLKKSLSCPIQKALSDVNKHSDSITNMNRENGCFKKSCKSTVEHSERKELLPMEETPFPKRRKLISDNGNMDGSKSRVSGESETNFPAMNRSVTVIGEKAKEAHGNATCSLNKKLLENSNSNEMHLDKPRVDKYENLGSKKIVEKHLSSKRIDEHNKGNKVKKAAGSSLDKPNVVNDAKCELVRETCDFSLPPNEPRLDILLNGNAGCEFSNPSIKKESCKKSEDLNFDKNKWFKLPWEERMKLSFEQGKLILLCNFDLSLCGYEVEDVIQKAFSLSCSAKIIQHTTYSTSNFGQAFVTFASRKAAETVVEKLNEDCLMLSTGRPLIASFVAPCFPSSSSALCGHFVVDKQKRQTQREMQAVFTSHCSQPNTIEYDMAKEWCVAHKRSDREWKALLKRQMNDVRNVDGTPKSK